MPKLVDVTPEDETISRTFHLETPKGGSLPVRVTFYPHRATWTPPKDEDIPGYTSDLSDQMLTALRGCAQVAHLAESWDMVGPWPPTGERVCGEDEMIPLTVPVLMTVTPWIVIQLSEKINEALYPNLRRSRESRRR